MGIGPGDLNQLTPRARNALAEADVVVGYATYVRLIAPLLEGKRVIGSGMTREQERCRLALRLAREGRQVVLVSGGDPGIYGMAGPMLELIGREATPGGAGPSDFELEVIPGITAASAAAGALGAPLANDFGVVSLSDLLVPWEVIARRLEALAAADLVIALYNPRSSRRFEQLNRACGILLRHREPGTPVGVVRKAGQPAEEVQITTLGALAETTVDMNTTVIVGNSSTRVVNGWLVTSRGYRW